MAQDDELRAIVRRMIERGDSDQQIALVISRYREQDRPKNMTPDVAAAVERSRETPSGAKVMRAPTMRERVFDEPVPAALRKHLPAIGAAAAAMSVPATGGGSLMGLAPILAAGGGGYLGSRLEGSDRATAMKEGGRQALFQAVPVAAMKTAKGAYNIGIPKAVRDKFRGVDIAGKGIEEGAVLGTTQGVNAATRAQQGARAAQTAAAPGVQPLSARQIQQGFQSDFADAMRGKMYDDANAMAEYVQNSTQQIGARPLTGSEQVARASRLQRPSASTLNSRNPQMTALQPQFANRERAIINENLRAHPPMAAARDAAQASKGLKQAALQTEHSTPLNRLLEPGGGFWSSLKMPSVSSTAGILGGTASQVLNPNTSRLLFELMRARSNPQE